jgi:hypothetical protein
MNKPIDFTHLDDPAFLNERACLRGRLEKLQENAKEPRRPCVRAEPVGFDTSPEPGRMT